LFIFVRAKFRIPAKFAGGEFFQLDDSEAVGTIIWLVLMAIGLSLGLWGIGQFVSANYSNPIQAVQQQAGGLLAAGLGWTLVLVLLGAASVVGAVLSFISDRARGGL
jgi:hypothetical protein